MCSIENVQLKGYLLRGSSVIWRDIAGEVVIAEKNDGTIRALNKTASIIWSLADGTRRAEDIVTDLYNRFEVTMERARADVDEFCRELTEANLISLIEKPESK